jgi:hypothetical protein
LSITYFGCHSVGQSVNHQIGARNFNGLKDGEADNHDPIASAFFQLEVWWAQSNPARLPKNSWYQLCLHLDFNLNFPQLLHFSNFHWCSASLAQ